nr:GDSL-type esterase/lipase family protein [Cohnella sp. WQ 127256]
MLTIEISPRKGGDAIVIRYAAIGDSLTAGVGDLFGGGFVPKYGRYIQEAIQQPVTYDKIGFPGARSAYILTVIRSDNKVRDILQHADIITLTVGGNDLVDAAKAFAVQQNDEPFRQALVNCKHNFAGILSTIRQLKSGRNPYLIRAVDLYNPSPSLPESDYWVKRFNQHLESFEDGNMKVANIFNSFKGRERALLWIDHLHPNARGYQVIAEALHDQGYTPFSL